MHTDSYILKSSEHHFRREKPLRIQKSLFGFLLTLTLLISSSLPASAADTSAHASTAASAKPIKYVALGDSLTVGYEPDMDMTVMPYGFVDRVYEQALYHGRASAANYGLGGLTSTGLKLMIDAVSSGKKATVADIQPGLPDFRADTMLADPAKIKKDLAEATLITITIGGNDLGTSIIKKVVTNELTDEALQTFVTDTMKQYKANLTAVLTSLYALNKTAQVVIADQYQPYPPLNQDIYKRLNTIKDSFSAALQSVVQSFKDQKVAIQIAPVAQAFVGQEGILTYIVGKQDIHPNQIGYATMSEVFAKTIWGDVKTAVRVKGMITVVVGGRQLDTPHLPVLIQDSTFVPLREYTEALGAHVDWTAETQTATIHLNGNVVELSINSNVMKVNGVAKTISDIPLSQMSNDEQKTYVPLRLMVEGLGLDVQYAAGSHTAYINL
jgi:lysophospholipase L1-like esterase